MKLSIITVNLNNREGLQKTIDSVFNQTFCDFEWIVIDGGSTDGSKELIKQYADHFTYWVSEPDKGIYNAMNNGVKVANGEYIQFLNSGDWLYNEHALSDIWGRNDIPTEDIVYGTIVDGIPFQYPKKLSLEHFVDSTLFHQSTFIKRKLLLETPYDESYKITADQKFFMEQIVLHHASYRGIDKRVSCFQPGGISSNHELHIKEQRRILEDLFSPMEIELIDNYMNHKYAYMTPYYNYIDKNPKLSKFVRRIVRLHNFFNNKEDLIQ